MSSLDYRIPSGPLVYHKSPFKNHLHSVTKHMQPSVGLQRNSWIFMHTGFVILGSKTNTCKKVSIHLYSTNCWFVPNNTSWPCHFNRIAGNVPNNCTIVVGTFAKIGHKVWLLVRPWMMESHWLFASFQQLRWWNGSRSHDLSVNSKLPSFGCQLWNSHSMWNVTPP